MNGPTCTRILIPLGERRTRVCGKPAAFAVGNPPDVPLRSLRCVATARARGERLVPLVPPKQHGPKRGYRKARP